MEDKTLNKEEYNKRIREIPDIDKSVYMRIIKEEKELAKRATMETKFRRIFYKVLSEIVAVEENAKGDLKVSIGSIIAKAKMWLAKIERDTKFLEHMTTPVQTAIRNNMKSQLQVITRMSGMSKTFAGRNDHNMVCSYLMLKVYQWMMEVNLKPFYFAVDDDSDKNRAYIKLTPEEEPFKRSFRMQQPSLCELFAFFFPSSVKLYYSNNTAKVELSVPIMVADTYMMYKGGVHFRENDFYGPACSEMPLLFYDLLRAKKVRIFKPRQEQRIGIKSVPYAYLFGDVKIRELEETIDYDLEESKKEFAELLAEEAKKKKEEEELKIKLEKANEALKEEQIKNMDVESIWGPVRKVSAEKAINALQEVDEQQKEEKIKQSLEKQRIAEEKAEKKNDEIMEGHKSDDFPKLERLIKKEKTPNKKKEYSKSDRPNKVDIEGQETGKFVGKMGKMNAGHIYKYSVSVRHAHMYTTGKIILNVPTKDQERVIKADKHVKDIKKKIADCKYITEELRSELMKMSDYYVSLEASDDTIDGSTDSLTDFIAEKAMERYDDNGIVKFVEEEVKTNSNSHLSPAIHTEMDANQFVIYLNQQCQFTDLIAEGVTSVNVYESTTQVRFNVPIHPIWKTVTPGLVINLPAITKQARLRYGSKCRLVKMSGKFGDVPIPKPMLKELFERCKIKNYFDYDRNIMHLDTREYSTAKKIAYTLIEMCKDEDEEYCIVIVSPESVAITTQCKGRMVVSRVSGEFSRTPKSLFFGKMPIVISKSTTLKEKINALKQMREEGKDDTEFVRQRNKELEEENEAMRKQIESMRARLDAELREKNGYFMDKIRAEENVEKLTDQVEDLKTTVTMNLRQIFTDVKSTIVEITDDKEAGDVVSDYLDEKFEELNSALELENQLSLDGDISRSISEEEQTVESTNGEREVIHIIKEEKETAENASGTDEGKLD